MADAVVRPSSKMIKVSYAACVVIALLILGGGYYKGLKLEVLLIIPAILLLWSAGKHVSLRFTTLTISSGRLRFEQGVFSKMTRSLELAKVQDVRVDQTLGQRILGLGTLTLETAGESGSLTMTSIDQPQEVADRILGAARGQ